MCCPGWFCSPRAAQASLTARVPGRSPGAGDAAAQALLHEGSGLSAGHQDVPEQGDVGDGQAQGVDLGEAFLEGEGGHEAPELVEGRVDAEHPPPLAQVGGAALPGPLRWHGALVQLSIPARLCQPLQEQVLQLAIGIYWLPERKFRSGGSLLEVVARFLHALARQAQGSLATSS